MHRHSIRSSPLLKKNLRFTCRIFEGGECSDRRCYLCLALLLVPAVEDVPSQMRGSSGRGGWSIAENKRWPELHYKVAVDHRLSQRCEKWFCG